MFDQTTQLMGDGRLRLYKDTVLPLENAVDASSMALAVALVATSWVEFASRQAVWGFMMAVV